MYSVLIACLPGVVAQWYFFGYGNIVQIMLASLTALIVEAFIIALRKRSIKFYITDGSALVTALLIGLSVPGYSPWWIVVIGTSFAIIIAKQLYGGLGYNLFNPAMIAYVVLLISFPLQMTLWPAPVALATHSAELNSALAIIFTGNSAQLTALNLTLGTDGLTIATPLDEFKTRLTMSMADGTIKINESFDYFTNTSWIWINISFIIGGCYLIWRKTIGLLIPLSFLISLLMISLVGFLFSPHNTLPVGLQLFSGATMFAAFFIFTDPVTAASTPKGQVYYGILLALLVYSIRRWGNYPDAIAFAALLANICVPLIDILTLPRAYGHQLRKIK